MNEWKEIIPEELHSDFQRQVEERVCSELMALILGSSDGIDEPAMEASLTEQFREYYQVQFLAKEWPPKVGVSLGVRAGELMGAHSDHWICAHCRERNFNSFETCRKCSENKPEGLVKTSAALPSQATKPAAPVVSQIWFCKECSGRNMLENPICVKCGLHQDVFKRDSWPLISEVEDPEERKRLRLSLFRKVLQEFGVEDPFCSIEISHLEFTTVISELKKRVINEFNQQDI